MGEEGEELAELLGGVDPFLMNYKRFAIVTLLYAVGPMTVGELKRALGFSWGDLDSKLRSLEERGYVSARKVLTLAGPRTLVELTEKGVRAYEELRARLRSALDAAGRKA
ncbi:transcriptional regulator [Thermofilum pendens]|uniref:Transcriptional regulator, MarR family n=1 Tax=Thermofilum pendens (strain DSM 2475 / Hrk 5) TaxID=368408 RepID=A1RYS3_THEPD|nr:transcriptional regulator [Thermofilum pendens]ABL78353.1 transcriptional regulator, MarR family [Thermofilum pendens Hrk 5]